MSKFSAWDDVFTSVHQLARGRVWCTKCGRSHPVNSREAMRSGWPKCCGYTMTIDSLEERAALAKARGETS